MAILVYFILGIGLNILGIVLFGIDIEWWVPTMSIVFGIFCLFLSGYHLNEECGFIDDFIEKRKKAKADKIANGKFNPEPMSMVPMFIKAYEERKELGNGYIMTKAKKFIKSGYDEILRNWTFVARETTILDGVGGEENVKKILFEAIEAEMVLLICLDEELSGDYEIYCDFCRSCGFTPRTKTGVRQYCDELSKDKYKKAIDKITFFYGVARRCVSPYYYERIVQGFCYLSLSDNIVNGNEYDVICASFFSKDIDTFPKTWEQFKLEYK